MASEDEAKPQVAYISAGGVEVRLEGEAIARVWSEAFALWQKVFDTVSNGRNRIGSGSGFVTETLLDERSAVANLKSAAGKRAAEALIAKKCFHPFPCHCAALGG